MHKKGMSYYWVVIDHTEMQSLWKNKTEILWSRTYVNTIVWMCHLDFNKSIGKKPRWEVHKNAACSFEQILEAALHKTAAIPPLAPYLKNHPN